METTKEIAVIETQVAKCIEATKIVITNQDEYDQAVMVGKKVSALLKLIDDKEKAITKPINDSLKQIRDMFRPYKTQVETAKDSIKAQMNAYVRAEEEKKRIETARIAARVEKGTMREDTAVNKLVDIQAAAPVTSGTMTSVLVLEVTDKAAIPMEYLIVDESAIKAAFRQGKEVPGTKCHYEKSARL